MSAAEYLVWSLLAASCAVGSARIFVAAEHHGAVAQSWLAALAFCLWSALAAACLWEAA